MNRKVKAFLKRKDVVFSASRYGIDALGAMAQGLFASLLIGTILSTLESAGDRCSCDHRRLREGGHRSGYGQSPSVTP